MAIENNEKSWTDAVMEKLELPSPAKVTAFQILLRAQ